MENKSENHFQHNNKIELLDGRILADTINHKLRRIIVEENLQPTLAVVLVGDDPASHLYVNLKKKACEKIGIEVSTYFLDKQCTQAEVEETIQWLNNDETCDAILVQLPLPKHINTDKIINLIQPDKDADGFHPDNLKKMYSNQATVFPAPAHAVVRLIKSSDYFRSGLTTAVISNNDIFFQPIKHLLQPYNIITTYYSPDDIELINKESKSADIIVVAVGQPNFINQNHIQKDAIVIDVGTNRQDNKTIGDVDFDNVKNIAGSITPVPGGVGPMTIACLLENVVNLHKQKS